MRLGRVRRRFYDGRTRADYAPHEERAEGHDLVVRRRMYRLSRCNAEPQQNLAHDYHEAHRACPP